MCHVTKYCIEPILFNGFMFGLALTMPTKYGSMYCTDCMPESSADIWNNSSKKSKFVLLLCLILNGQGKRLNFFNLDFI